MRSKKPFIKDTLLFLNVTGLSPKSRGIFSRLRTILTATIGSTTGTFMILETILNWHGVDSLDGLDAFAAVFGIILKIGFLIAHADKIDKLLEDVNRFWSIEEIDQEVQKTVKQIYTFVKKFRVGVVVNFYATLCAYTIKPFLTGERTLPLKFYQPFDLNLSRYIFIYLIQTTHSLLLVTIMLSVLFLFMTFITHATCELKALKYKFANLEIDPNGRGDDEKSLKEFDILIEHHNFVLRFIKEVSKLFSPIMLIQYLASMFCVCLGLFGLTVQGFPPAPSVGLKYALFLSSFVGELFVYCIGGDVIVEEVMYIGVMSLTVANEVYKSDWWIKTQPKLRKRIVLVMLRAQKAETITVGGMLKLDLECFSTVMRTAFSFFTLMQAMR